VSIAPIAVVRPDTPAARIVAGGVVSLLTAVGRWVEEVPADAELSAYGAVVLARGHGWRAVRERFPGPLLVVDADLLGGRPDPAFAARLDGPAAAVVDVRGTQAPLPHALPRLAGTALGDAPSHVAVLAARGMGYLLPILLTPAIRTVRGFWTLAGVVEEAVAALVGEARATYVEPWPRGRRAPRVLTLDLDDITGPDPLRALMAAGRPGTLFCCADGLGHLGPLTPAVELAAHGDTHRPFADERTNLTRVDHMLAAFRAAGLAPRGFSPPNLVYTSALAPLFERFAYVRLGYQERALRFFPAAGPGVTMGVSFYPDFAQRYVGVEEYTRLMAAFCTWAAATNVLAVPCLHPCVWGESLPRYLAGLGEGAWETTCGGIADWWARRRAALTAGRPDDAVVTVTATPAERLTALSGAVVDPPRPPARPRAVQSVRVSGKQYAVVPAGATPEAATEIPGPGWPRMGRLPRPLRRLASRALLQVTNRNGLHACFYGDLGLVAEVAPRGIRLPLRAPDEPLMLTRPAAEYLGRLARRMLGRWRTVRTAGAARRDA
jgi:hypothetical protein